MIPLAVICGLALCVSAADDPEEAGSERRGMSGKGKGKGSGMGKGKGRSRSKKAPNTEPSMRSPGSPSLETNPEGVAFFKTRIEPVLEESCYRCHRSDGKTKGGLALDTRNALLEGGDSGPAVVVSGEAERSLLITSIRWGDEDLEMPPKKQLADSVIADFETWIAMGAPYAGSDSITAEQGPPETADPGDGIYGTITGIFNGEVIFAKSSSGGGRGGKGKGRRGGGNEAAYPVANSLMVTTGTIARRTSAFQPGMELGGGLDHPIFDELEDGGRVRARVVIDEEENRITEINVIVADATMEEGIAVRPKRPPMKTEVGR